CRASRARRSDRGSHVHRRSPWCCRWLALPLAARTIGQLGSGRRRTALAAHPVAQANATGLGLRPPLRADTLPYRGFQHQLHRAVTFVLADSPWHLRWPARGWRLRPFGFCRPPIHSSATFTAPFSIRSEPDEDDVVRSSESPALHGAPSGGVW